MNQLTPRQIVVELNKHIIGQEKAKKAVAIALRNRWRRQQVEEPLRQEITPKNILMIGPTGVGKTEIARRLAKLSGAPFIKVEATKFTEVGYVGKDVETIIRDLVEMSIKMTREAAVKRVKEQAERNVEEKILDLLLPSTRPYSIDEGEIVNTLSTGDNPTREKFRTKLKAGQLDEKEIDVEISAPAPQMEIFSPPGMEEITTQLQSMFQSAHSGKKQTKRMTIAQARITLAEEESQALVNDEEIKFDALKTVEQSGIVFLDEVDKIAARDDGRGVDVSRQGVQRDLLPLIEGTTVSTKYGSVKTDHILFIASGAFHLTKPSDLIPEFQGRLPIRVEMDALSVSDFEKILTSTDACLTKQYEALLKTENLNLVFEPGAIHKMAEIAFDVNNRIENIGARRLYTVMEKLLEEISFSAEAADQSVDYVVTAEMVSEKLGSLAASDDLARYIL